MPLMKMVLVSAKDLFYNRAAADLDGRFADPAQDTWRPTEIFADAIAILSDTFLDGEIEDTFVVEARNADPSFSGNPNEDSSFLNFHRPCHYRLLEMRLLVKARVTPSGIEKRRQTQILQF